MTPPPLDEDDEDDGDELDDLAEELEEPLSEPVADEDDDAGGVAIAPPSPAPPGSEDLSDQLRYAVILFEDAMFVSEGWADRARYGLGDAPVEWTEP